jgi:hypothetical protein
MLARTARFLSGSVATVFLSVCEFRHIALPRIELLYCFSLDCDPSLMTGPFLRSARPRHASISNEIIATTRDLGAGVGLVGGLRSAVWPLKMNRGAAATRRPCPLRLVFFLWAYRDVTAVSS